MGHDPRSQTAEVEYQSGAVYHYYGVSEAEYQAILAAPSIGAAVNKRLKKPGEQTWKKIG